ncbi:hypothetical protein N7493_008006 [Penicillium malachiteum]|uniref:ABC transporter domain-containing protein n=1 Tax=Penicillium malachiteum TaxID=1324776 RepID=A0AAD6MTI7_9EURO|nr:hypothetical protein N7493_008006 [Penicillium malachiteum]
MGWSTIISVSDMPEVDENLQGDVARLKLQKFWEKSKGTHRLMKAVFCAYLLLALSGVLPRLMLCGFTFCQPGLITSTVDYFSGDAESKPKEYGQALIGAFLIVYMGIALSTSVYWRQTYRLTAMIRAGLISSLTNCEQLQVLARNMGLDRRGRHSTLSITTADWTLMYSACNNLSCMRIWFGSDICKNWTSTKGLGRKSRRTDSCHFLYAERYEIGPNPGAKPCVLRTYHQVASGRAENFYSISQVIGLDTNIPTDLAPYATFAVYAIISLVRNDQSLATSQAFTSLSLISLMTSPLLSFVQAAPSFTESFGCFERIETYLEKPANSSSHEQPFGLTGAELTQPEYPDKPSTPPHVVSIKNADISWQSDSKPVLQNLSLTTSKGITMITGPVGSGKSALIKCLLGEMTVRKGSVNTDFGNVAYCPQIPWILDDTFRHNIIGSTTFDEKRYDFVISSCGLIDDFQSIPGGDMHVVGSNGASLSGGQKQRVALARAVYSRLPVIILDDIFNGLDSKRTSDISSKLFAENGYFRTANKNVIMVTHTD